MLCLGAFGLPGQSGGDDALRATKAATRIHQQLAKGGHRATIGVTTGKAYCGIIGSAERHEYGASSNSVATHCTPLVIH